MQHAAAIKSVSTWREALFSASPRRPVVHTEGPTNRIMSHSCLAVQRINAFKAAIMFFFFKLQKASSCPLLLPRLYSLDIKIMREFVVRN
jgi:hypothetical protein